MTNEHKFDHGQSTSLQLAKQYMGKEVTVTIDRPIGSKHPKHGTIYPINYGYLEGVQAPDGEDLDAYVLGVDGPCSTFTGHCVAISIDTMMMMTSLWWLRRGAYSLATK